MVWVMKKFFAIILFLSVAFAATAQKVRFNIKFLVDTANIEKVYVQPLNVDVDSKTIPMRKKGNAFTGTVNSSSPGFYNLVVLKDHSQLIVPVYAGAAESVELDVTVKGKVLTITDTPENSALSSLSHAINTLDKRLWVESNMSGEQMKQVVVGYQVALDSIISKNRIKGAVAEYMTVYAYAHAYNAYASMPRAQEIPITSIPFGRNDVLPEPNIAFDNSYAPLFFVAMQIVKDGLTTSPSLLDKLHSLYATYKNSDLRSKVASLIMNEFLSRYNYSKGYEAGLDLVKVATKEYGLPDTYIKEFIKYRSTIPGAPFPEGIVLVDAEGNVVDFSTFKGKYVYVDLWASWCGPCCKEIPYMKKLEKELENKDVVFVSVSCDTDVLAWKNKMKELDMQGVQLLDKENVLGDALNVKGIPFYLIYDKEGNLHTYGAKRPSTGFVLKEILEGLK